MSGLSLQVQKNSRLMVKHYHISTPFQGNFPINCSLQSIRQLSPYINKSFIFVTKKGCILSAPLLFYNFDTQHAQFMYYIQMTTGMSVNNRLAVVIRLLPEHTQGRFTATLNYGILSMAKRKGDSSVHCINCAKVP